MKLISAILLFLSQISQADVLVVHAQDGYDYSRKTKVELERILSLYSETERHFLKNENGSWFIEPQGKFIASRFGEHQLDILGSHITLMGSQLGACIQYAFLDILNHSPLHELMITIPTRAVSTISGDTLQEVLAPLSEIEQEIELKRTFSRFPEYLKRKNVKILIHRNGRKMGTIKMNGSLSQLNVYLNVID